MSIFVLLGAVATMIGARLRSKKIVLVIPATNREIHETEEDGSVQMATAGKNESKEYPNKQNIVENLTLGSYCLRIKYITNGTPKR